MIELFQSQYSSAWSEAAADKRHYCFYYCRVRIWTTVTTKGDFLETNHFVQLWLKITLYLISIDIQIFSWWFLHSLFKNKLQEKQMFEHMIKGEYLQNHVPCCSLASEGNVSECITTYANPDWGLSQP